MSADLRRLALNTPPFDPTARADEPYAVITEFLQGETVVTMSAFATGDASIYFSTGGGIIGLVGKPDVAALARQAVADIAGLASRLDRSDALDPPGQGEFCFYVLTPGGRRVCRVHASGTAQKDGPEVQLIRSTGALLTKIREVSAKR